MELYNVSCIHWIPSVYQWLSGVCLCMITWTTICNQCNHWCQWLITIKPNDWPHQIIQVHSGMQLCIDIVNINQNPSQTSQTSVASLHSFENTQYQAKVACEMVICTRLNNIDIYNQCDVGTELLFSNLKVQIVHIVIKSNLYPSCHAIPCHAW